MKELFHFWWHHPNPKMRWIIGYNLLVWAGTLLSTFLKVCLRLPAQSEAVTLVLGAVAFCFGLWMISEIKAMHDNTEQALAEQKLLLALEVINQELTALFLHFEEEWPKGRIFDMDHAETVQQTMPYTVRSLTNLRRYVIETRILLLTFNSNPLSRKRKIR